jgi:hypothetical protein
MADFDGMDGGSDFGDFNDGDKKEPNHVPNQEDEREHNGDGDIGGVDGGDDEQSPTPITNEWLNAGNGRSLVRGGPAPTMTLRRGPDGEIMMFPIADAMADLLTDVRNNPDINNPEFLDKRRDELAARFLESTVRVLFIVLECVELKFVHENAHLSHCCCRGEASMFVHQHHMPLHECPLAYSSCRALSMNSVTRC